MHKQSTYPKILQIAKWLGTKKQNCVYKMRHNILSVTVTAAQMAKDHKTKHSECMKQLGLRNGKLTFTRGFTGDINVDIKLLNIKDRSFYILKLNDHSNLYIKHMFKMR